MLISATHTHSGGSLLSALGTKADPAYWEFVPGRLVECIKQAAGNLRAGPPWAGPSEDYPDGRTAASLIRRPGSPRRRSAGAAERRGDDAIRVIRTRSSIGRLRTVRPPGFRPGGAKSDGKPIALAGDYSMHYFGARADLGRLLRRLGADRIPSAARGQTTRSSP